MLSIPTINQDLTFNQDHFSVLTPLYIKYDHNFSCSSWCTLLNWLRLQMEIPVNRFLHWEFSKVLFYVIILMTLTEEKDIDVWDYLAMAWIVSYLLENVRTIHRLYRFSKKRDSKRIFKRWLTFRNLYILATDLIFFTSLILRSVAYLNNQGPVPYLNTGIPYDILDCARVLSRTM